MVDPFHLQAHNIIATNYNRDIENFPILKRILKKIGSNIYSSPTEMGVSKAKQGIIDSQIVKEASKQEVIRRYFRYKKENILGLVDKEVVGKVEKLMQELEIKEDYRKVVINGRQSAIDAEKQEDKGNNRFYCGSAIQIGDKIISGKNSKLLHSESACIINVLKYISNVPDDIDLLSESLINSIKELKEKTVENSNPSLDVSEILIALAVSSSTNPTAKKCIDNIPFLKNCEMHATHLSTKGDETGIRDLGINLTTDAELTPTIYFKN